MAIIRTSKVDIPINGYDAYAFVARPDDELAHPGIVLIQEWWGIEPHVIDLAQKLASEGFVVAIPDLYHAKVATEPDDAMRMMMLLRQNVERAVREIIGTLDTIKALPYVQPKKIGLIGFCLGGFLAYTTASHYRDLGALVSFYGGGYDPTPEEVARVQAPVFAVYGSQDQNISPEQIKKIERLYKDAGKDFTVRVYNAGHAFLNPTHGAGNEAAAKDVWPRVVSFFREHVH